MPVSLRPLGSNFAPIRIYFVLKKELLYFSKMALRFNRSLGSFIFCDAIFNLYIHVKWQAGFSAS